MENRYELFSKVGARNIAGFNAKVAEYNAQSEMKQVPLPLIVVIVDEFGRLDDGRNVMKLGRCH